MKFMEMVKGELKKGLILMKKRDKDLKFKKGEFKKGEFNKGELKKGKFLMK